MYYKGRKIERYYNQRLGVKIKGTNNWIVANTIAELKDKIKKQ